MRKKGDTMHVKWRDILQALWGKSRFTSYFFQSVNFQEEKGIPTLALTVSASRFILLYNPEFLDARKEDELTGLLVHEMLHIYLNHHHRAISGEDPFLQNLAQDMVINSYIADHEKTFFSRAGRDIRDAPRVTLPDGLPRIPGAFYEGADRKKKAPAWEEVFAWLKANCPDATKNMSPNDDEHPGAGLPAALDADFPDAGEAPGQASSRDDMPNRGALFHLSIEEKGLVFKDHGEIPLPTGVHLLQQSRQKSSAAAIKIRMLRFAGRDDTCRSERLYQKLSALIEDVKPVQIRQFRQKLNRFIEYASRSDEWGYSASRFNRRYFGAGIYAPGRVYKKLKTITIAVDVSGSVVMTPGAIENAFGAIEALLVHYRIHLLCMDEDLFVPRKRKGRFVSSEDFLTPYVYQKGDWRYLRTGSSGATFFEPLFNHHMPGHREPLVVMTDGEIFDLHQLNPYARTLWVVPDNLQTQFDPPFGEIGVIGG